EVLCLPRLRDLYPFLSFMVGGESVNAGNATRIANEVKPFLLEQHPWLANISDDEIAGPQVKEKLKPYVDQYGEFHECTPIPAQAHEHLDTAEDLHRLGYTGPTFKL